MKKSRIVIAGEDPAYMEKLQDKLAEHLLGQIDLEMITDRDYFISKFLSVPQEAELLVVSENFYDPGIGRHQLGIVFLLTEEPPPEQQDKDGLERIYKYTGIREIYSEIISKSAAILKPDRQKNREPKILAVTSAAGGTGKTTVAMGLGAALAMNHRSVLYLNCGKLQTFPYFSPACVPAAGEDVYLRLRHPDGDLFTDLRDRICRGRFCYFPPLAAPVISLGIRQEAFLELACGAKRSSEYEVIILDTDSVYDEDKARLLQISDQVILVTEQSDTCVCATKVLAENLADAGSEKYCCICNKYDETRPNSLNSPDAGKLPYILEYIRKADSYEAFRQSGFTDDPGIRRAVWQFV